jgi:hypothetical protein
VFIRDVGKRGGGLSHSVPSDIALRTFEFANLLYIDNKCDNSQCSYIPFPEVVNYPLRYLLTLCTNHLIVPDMLALKYSFCNDRFFRKTEK